MSCNQTIQYVYTFPKSIKVTKTDRYSVELMDWLDEGEVLGSCSVVCLNNKASLVQAGVSGSKIIMLLTGVTAGEERLKISYSTDGTARSDEITVRLHVTL
jgi:hypothetical protein